MESKNQGAVCSRLIGLVGVWLVLGTPATQAARIPTVNLKFSVVNAYWYDPVANDGISTGFVRFNVNDSATTAQGSLPPCLDPQHSGLCLSPVFSTPENETQLELNRRYLISADYYGLRLGESRFSFPGCYDLVVYQDGQPTTLQDVNGVATWGLPLVSTSTYEIELTGNTSLRIDTPEACQCGSNGTQPQLVADGRSQASATVGVPGLLWSLENGLDASLIASTDGSFATITAGEEEGEVTVVAIDPHQAAVTKVCCCWCAEREAVRIARTARNLDQRRSTMRADPVPFPADPESHSGWEIHPSSMAPDSSCSPSLHPVQIWPPQPACWAVSRGQIPSGFTKERFCAR
jgi:hypothetical protein